MTIIVPNAASVYTACAIVPNSRERWAWLGLVPGVGASASAMFMVGSALADASPLMPMTIGAGGQPYQTPVFSSPGYPIIVASVTGGSAVVWLKAGAS